MTKETYILKKECLPIYDFSVYIFIVKLIRKRNRHDQETYRYILKK